MNQFSSLMKEIYKQLTNTPSFVEHRLPPLKYKGRLDAYNRQIDQALKDQKKGLIFLIGPYGSGKTTQFNYFTQVHSTHEVIYKSFEKIDSVDFAFLHMTSFLSRTLFLFLSVLLGTTLVKLLPESGALPLSLLFIYFFVKNVPNLLYIFHETITSIFNKSPKYIIIEDLERSSLGSTGMWVFLANLWQYKRFYIVSLGYPVEDIKAKQSMIENAMKLEGCIIDFVNDELLNVEVIDAKDSSFTACFDVGMAYDKSSWISLFTPREMLIIHQEIRGSLQKESKKDVNASLLQVNIFLKYLLQKIQIDPRLAEFNGKTHQVDLLSEQKLSPEAEHYIQSFSNSVKQIATSKQKGRAKL